MSAELRPASIRFRLLLAKASVLKAKTDSEVLALLTPEQRQKMTERAERMKERMQERQEKRQPQA